MNSKVILRYAIDLLWVRVGKVGGIESYIRNLLDGMITLTDVFEVWLLVSLDNAYSFKKYTKDNRFHIYVCDIESKNVGKRIVWQNFYLGKTIRKLGLDKCFEPYYCKPILGTHGIKFVTTIHDLQAIHFPEYFSRFKVLWMKLSWYCAINQSTKIVAISDFVKDDILKYYKINPDKIKVIYNPVVINTDEVYDENFIENKYGIRANEYFFSVSSLLPHKNIDVLIEIMKKIKDEDMNLPQKMIITGVGGKSKESLLKKIKEYGLINNIIFTPFIDNKERNTLYKYCKMFLFPSIFEGFGMPPIEAMLFNKIVITTKKTSIMEVTQGKCIYVKNPFSEDEWILRIEEYLHEYNIKNIVYDKSKIAETYYKLFYDL